MKVRTDFVSNSSSSSFICTPADAAHIELFNKSEKLSLHEYLKQFGSQDVLYGSWWDKKRKMKFVDNDTLCRKFATGIYHMLPFSAKDVYEVDHEDWDAMMLFVEEALQPVWGKEIFEYYEAEDSSCYGESSEYSWENNEESYLLRVFDHSSMKFSRIFNNH